MKCLTCGDYFRTSQWNNSKECENCTDNQKVQEYDSEDQVEVDILMNPSGVTRAVFYD